MDFLKCDACFQINLDPTENHILTTWPEFSSMVNQGILWRATKWKSYLASQVGQCFIRFKGCFKIGDLNQV